MDSDHIRPATLRDLACEIGQVQIYWSFLEHEMRSQLEAVGLLQTIARGPIITHWRTYLRQFANESGQCPIADNLNAVENVAKTRNLLAHCIQSVSVSPSESDSAFVICVGPGASTHKLTLEMIRELSEEIDRVRRMTRKITLPSRNQES